MAKVVDVQAYGHHTVDAVTIRFDCGCEVSDATYYPSVEWCPEHQELRDRALEEAREGGAS